MAAWRWRPSWLAPGGLRPQPCTWHRQRWRQSSGFWSAAAPVVWPGTSCANRCANLSGCPRIAATLPVTNASGQYPRGSHRRTTAALSGGQGGTHSDQRLVLGPSLPRDGTAPLSRCRCVRCAGQPDHCGGGAVRLGVALPRGPARRNSRSAGFGAGRGVPPFPTGAVGLVAVRGAARKTNCVCCACTWRGTGLLGPCGCVTSVPVWNPCRRILIGITVSGAASPFPVGQAASSGWPANFLGLTMPLCQGRSLRCPVGSSRRCSGAGSRNREILGTLPPSSRRSSSAAAPSWHQPEPRFHADQGRSTLGPRPVPWLPLLLVQIAAFLRKKIASTLKRLLRRRRVCLPFTIHRH